MLPKMTLLITGNFTLVFGENIDNTYNSIHHMAYTYNLYKIIYIIGKHNILSTIFTRYISNDTIFFILQQEIEMH